MSMGNHRNNRTRGLLLEHIQKNPGVSFVLLRNVFKMSESTLRYHLDYLQRKKRIALEKHDGRRCYYPFIRKCYPYSEGSLELNEEQERLLDLISISPGITFSELKDRSGLGNGTFVHNLNRLKEMRLIWKMDNKEGSGYEVLTRERISDEIFLVLIRRFLDGDLDRESLGELVDRLETYRDGRRDLGHLERTKDQG